MGVNWGACHFHRFAKTLKCPKPDRYEAELDYDRSYGPPWHVPPRFFAEELYPDADTFVVVRNPYDRALSEFYNIFGDFKGEDRNNPEALNAWVQDKIRHRTFANLLPMYLYAYDTAGGQSVTHVLHFENLAEEFNALMAEYGLPARMSETRVFSRRSSDRLNVEDLDGPTRRLLEKHAARDFELFGYEKMS